MDEGVVKASLDRHQLYGSVWSAFVQKRCGHGTLDLGIDENSAFAFFKDNERIDVKIDDFRMFEQQVRHAQKSVREGPFVEGRASPVTVQKS